MTITIVGGGNPSGPTFPVQRSVRLRSSASAYFNRTNSTSTNTNIWTWSGWVKRGTLGSRGVLIGGGTTNVNYICFNDTGTTDYFGLTYANTPASLANVMTTQVFRDTSAWYHLVVAYDSTSTTPTITGSSTDRVRLYVNGVQVTAFSATTAPGLNATSTINSSSTLLNIGRRNLASPDSYFDGYLTEVNFIDGQALTPSSFGAYNNYGVWSPAKYTGTYGTNGFYLPFTTNTDSETLGLDYANTNPELITNGMFTANVTGWTNAPFGGGTPSITWQSNHTARIANPSNNGTVYYQAITTVVGQTYYAQALVAAASIGGASRTIALQKADNAAFSVNNITIASIAQSAAPGVMRGTFVATATTTYIFINVDILGTGTTGADVSQISVALGGYKNSWNPFNISTTAGVTYDSMLDVPTLTSANNANFATLNPVGTPFANGTVTDGNLKFAGLTTTDKGVAATISIASGAFYWESTQLSSSGGQNCYAGLIVTGSSSDVNANRIYVRGDGLVYKYGTSLGAVFPTFTNNDTIGCAFNRTNNTLALYKNGVLGYTVTGVTNVDHTPWVGGYTTTDTWAINFGQRPFAGTVPTGFKSLNTYNLPAPTIPNGATQFAATLWAGNNGTQSILNSTNTTTGVSFQPDLVWLKQRSPTGTGHILEDSVRGALQYLGSESTAQESTIAGTVTAFNSNGFSIGNQAGTNATGSTYVGWSWKASNAAAVTNTNGTIPSQVSANPTAGFSIVTYTAQATGTATVGHGLNIAPSMIITKQRGTTGNWSTYHVSTTAANVIYLNLTNPSAASSTTWNSTAPTSSVFSLGSGFAGAGTIVAYCWSEIPGFSKFGSYAGITSADGPFVYLGFRPRWIMYKRSDTTGYSWAIWDTTRNTFNVVNQYLWANSAQIENSFSALDILSNGFKLRATDAGNNIAGGTYIYAAFAENPFNYSLAR